MSIQSKVVVNLIFLNSLDIIIMNGKPNGPLKKEQNEFWQFFHQ